jgi:hypothetical protein
MKMTWKILAVGVWVSMVVAGGRPVAAAEGWKGACVSGIEGGDQDVATIQGVLCLAANGLGVVLALFALVGFCMFVYAGVKLLLSGGQPSSMETAKNTYTYVVFGLILALSSFIILNVFAEFTGVDNIFKIDFNMFEQ